MTRSPFVAIFTGPPGCGKSTLAERASVVSGAPVANWDWLMSGLRVFPDVWAPIEADAERRRDVGYSLMCRIGEQQLRRGQSIIYDCITRPRAYERFGELANRFSADLHLVECVCSDIAIHESRIVGRRRDIPDWDEMEWQWVLNSMAIYESLDVPKLLIDAIDPVDVNHEHVARHLGLTSAPGPPGDE